MMNTPSRHKAVEDASTGPGDQRPPTPPASRGVGSALTKVTVNLVPRAMKALEDVSASTGDTKTESINRALQIYAWLQSRIDAGEQVVVVDSLGKPREIQIF